MSTKLEDLAEKFEQKDKNPYIEITTGNGSQTTTITTAQKYMFGSRGADFAVGALAGVAIVYFLTNEKANKAFLKTVAKGTNLLQAGFEELKERFEDAKAELETK